MVALAALIGLCGLALCFLAGPLYFGEVRKVIRGPEYVPVKVLGAAVLFALGLTLLGVTAWLSSTL